MRTFIAIVCGGLLALTCATASDARQHAKQVRPTQNEPIYYPDYNNTRDRDSSCFNSSGLPELYACSGNGG